LSSPDATPAELAGAADALDAAAATIRTAAGHLHDEGADPTDRHQAVAYDLAMAAASVDVARSALDYGTRGEEQATLACVFVADVLVDLAGRLIGRERAWGVETGALDTIQPFLARWRDPRSIAAVANRPGERHLDPELEMVSRTFRRFAEERIAPLAERIHRNDEDVPEEVITGLAELGAFGLSIPVRYGGSATGVAADGLAMVAATEELSRVSLGAGGSLVTRPEILARTLLAGGTEEQRRRWLPALARGEVMAAVAVTEPDHGSDAASVTLRAVPDGDEWVLSGTKTWCTFAARAEVLAVLARTEPDRSLAHRGLSVLLVDKPRTASTGFELTQPGGGRLVGRPIPTLGYRGMHSYEVAFDRWRVPAERLVGGDDGRGRGFAWQMQGFEAGRLQTAARAVGLMQAAYEAASDYASARVVFARPLGDHQLTQVKLGRMVAVIQACRQHAFAVARLAAAGGGSLEASMLKAYACRAAESVTREAQQLHGGIGYAEEHRVSRLWLDARVLSIFEGAEETLALEVVARRLVGAGRPKRRRELSDPQ
jgi:(2S)-methylsuccinyl-CoA dehydrogenase